jgi:V8-like Glu-specific endopeptidase
VWTRTRSNGTCLINDTMLHVTPPCRRRGPRPALCDSKVLMLELVGEYLGPTATPRSSPTSVATTRTSCQHSGASRRRRAILIQSAAVKVIQLRVNSSRIVILLSLVLLHRAAGAQEPTATPREQFLPEFSQAQALADARTPEHFPQTNPRWVWPQNGFYKHDTTDTTLRVRFRVDRLPQTGGWEILIYDRKNKLADRLTQEDFGEAPENIAWSKRITGNSFRVELRSSDAPEGLVLSLDQVNSPTLKQAPKAIVGTNEDLRDLVASFGLHHRYYTYSQPVVALFFVKAGGQVDTNCTGFMLTTDLLLTNNHCISKKWQMRTIDLRYNYEPGWVLQQQVNLEKAEIVAQSTTLDYTLVKLSQPVPVASVVKLDLTGPVKKGDQFVIIQHPNFKQKRINLIDCKADDPVPQSGPNDITNRCDTEGGSSGSPMMRESTGRVVGLHYGGLWTSDRKNNRNFAVKMSAVLNDIHQQADAEYQRIVQANSTP